MANKQVLVLILLGLITTGVHAQNAGDISVDGTADMDLTETEDLEKLLNESSPASPSDAVKVEEPIVEDASTVSATSDEPATIEEAPLMLTDDEPETSPADDALSEGVKTADPSLPEPLPAVDDELELLRADLRDSPLNENDPGIMEGDFAPSLTNETATEPKAPSLVGTKPTEVVNDKVNIKKNSTVFDVGTEEKELLEIAASVQGQISNVEWNELATQAQVSSYTVVKDDWLFKISKRLFGSGFYYPKIWALNSFITNPHLIEPGMILHFSTGNADRAPEVKLGAFTDTEIKTSPGAGNSELAQAASYDDFSVWGEESKPEWLNERQKLIDQGVYIQYSTGDTLKDLEDASKTSLIKDYENYEPPQSQIALAPPSNQYDKTGLDKNSKIVYKFKEGFYLNTFITNNPVQDLGKIDSGPDENVFFTPGDRMYLNFDSSLNILPGDRFSIYAAQGKVTHRNSDRTGYKYTITGQVKVLGKVGDLWEVEMDEAMSSVQRGDRVTVYTPRIERLTKTFNSRLIEAAVIGHYNGLQSLASYGDVVYIDRGRADGLEMGNVLETYGFKDRSNGKTIVEQPSYKTGELTVITLVDNFATCLVTNSRRDFYIGDIAATKTKEAALRDGQSKLAGIRNERRNLDMKALEELDVELKVDDLNDSLLDKADKIQLTEDELAELERQEREKSIIRDSERDLKALERLEREIEGAEKLLNEAKLDEDKLLEEQSLEDVEKNRGLRQQESLDEIEENLGKRYMDEDLNDKDNPYGLTEFDIEEVDELLNVEKKTNEDLKTQ